MSAEITREEYLMQALGMLDDSIFTEAYITDDKKAMKRLVIEEKIDAAEKIFSDRNLRRAGVAAVCIALCVVIVASVPFAVDLIKRAFDDAVEECEYQA